MSSLITILGVIIFMDMQHVQSFNKREQLSTIHKKSSPLQSTAWIETLALEEINLDESGIVHFNTHLDPAFGLEESSIELMDELRDKVETLVTRFNEYRGTDETGAQIKIFKISNTVNDFMLYRNSLRLVFARKSNDLITVGFLTSNGDFFGARSHNNMNNFTSRPHEINAHIGPFNKITWRYQGEPVDLDTLIKYYLSEFIRNSAR